MEEEDEVFTCEICIEPATSRFGNTRICSHALCTECVIKYIHVQLEDNNVGHIKCPAINCDRTLDPHACAALVGAPLFVQWCDVLCEEAIAGLDRCYCPQRNCNALIVNECAASAKKKSRCPNCKGWFCFECKREWHSGFFGCRESRDRNDVAFGRLAEEKKWVRCPGCRHFVERIEGCLTMTCRCGAVFCYKCGKPDDECRCNWWDNGTGRDWYAVLFVVIHLIVLIVLSILVLV